MSSYVRQQLENWLKTIDVKAGRVLDVGGAQLPVKGRTKSWEVSNYEIVDLFDPHQLHESLVHKRYIIESIESLRFVDVVGSEEADVIFCLEVMEYVLSPRQVFMNLERALKPKGVLYVSFPFIYPHHNPEGKDYLRYTRWGVEKLLTDAGFDIVDLVPRYSNLDLNSVWSGERMHPTKGLNHNEVGYLVKAIKI